MKISNTAKVQKISFPTCQTTNVREPNGAQFITGACQLPVHTEYRGEAAPRAANDCARTPLKPLGSHRCVSEVSRDNGVARVLKLGGSPESAQNRWRWCVAASWNAWYAPKALRQARLVRLRSRKCWLQLSWTRTRKLRHWGRYATEVDIAVVPCFSFNLLSHRLTSKDAQGS